MPSELAFAELRVEMRLAWFRPASSDATAALVAALRAAHDLDVFTRANAHHFVSIQFRIPYDLCVFELDNTDAHAFVWPYLLHYGGVLLLASGTLHDSRASALIAAGRREDYATEFRFNERHAPRFPRTGRLVPAGRWPMLRVPLTTARMTVVPNGGLADALRFQYAEARIVYAPLPPPLVDVARARRADVDATVTFGILADDRVDLARRALARAQALGATAALVADRSAARLLSESDVVLALAWPPGGPPERLAHAALAAGTPVVTLETILASAWPALDPQTWRPRGVASDRPIAVTVDLRDEEHALMMAMRRLAADASLRSALGDAARAWSRAHESLPVACETWERLLHEATRLATPPHTADWPAHLTADGTERARAILAEFGVTVDLF